ncbi:MFS transporter [Saccharothrix sp. S26]|uniref:MFS transporter n=1 Tax=Saccharothrix sp. S26 TaxID=2907215 RepID=UPI001F2FDA51|nr:MFS transporter [Saccharothrix sp. S26]MCE6998919.1 MFS transporter [Saccharothrix sp. S26]
MTGPLGVPAFRRLWIAGFVSEIGDWVLLVALPVYVYQRTGSAAATATTFVVALLPSLALSPLAGVLADRWDRRRLMLVVSFAQAVTLLPLLTGDLVLVNVVTAVQAGLAALFEPAKNALLPTLVPREQVPAANGLVGLNANLARLVGASLGGLLLARTGLPGVVLADVASFLLAAALLATLGTRDPARGSGTPAWRAWVDGLREIRGPLRPMVGVVALMATGQGLFVVLFVVFVTERLGGGAGEVGVLRGVQAVGGLLGGLLVGVLARRLAPGRVLGWSLVGFAVVAAVGWNGPRVTTALVFYLAAFVVVGVPGVIAGAGMVSVLQLHSSDEVRGRVMATFVSLFDGGQALGMVLAGVLTPVLGLSALLNAQAGLYLAAGVLALAVLDVPARARTG